jgi:serine/threonine protein kinase
MSLTTGSRLGPYEIASLLGAGGMGEVYRARDTKLDRDVAIKVLPDALAADPERIARFEREARTLAALNHPNIAHVHGLEEADGVRALVMELVEGPTLEDRLTRGPIPLEEALPIARQIADGLEAAHESGIIHRDLKPANVKVRPDGMVKILDFGLARAFDPAPTSSASATNSPTLSLRATYVGMILGTAAYMSPQQAAGKPVDKRADIWSFGVVLWEMLTGASCFAARRSRTRWQTCCVPTSTSRCSPQIRRQSSVMCYVVVWIATSGGACATSARRALRSTARQPESSIPAIPTTGRAAATGRDTWWRRGTPAALSAMLAAGLVAVAAWILRPSVAPPAVTRFTIALPEPQQLTNTGRQFIGISPDGRQIAYFANRQIYLRPMAGVEAKPITGTQFPTGISNLAFSPDGRSIAFWMGEDRTLKRIDVTGGTAMTLCTVATNPFGMSWSDAGILFAVAGQGIMRVAANGGTPELVARVPNDEISYGPQMLPDHATLLFSVSKSQNRSWDNADIVVQ